MTSYSKLDIVDFFIFRNRQQVVVTTGTGNDGYGNCDCCGKHCGFEAFENKKIRLNILKTLH